MWYDLYLATESCHFCLYCIEERKMDQLFLEAEGNRQIANQTAQRAFLARQDILLTGQKVASWFFIVMANLIVQETCFGTCFYCCALFFSFTSLQAWHSMGIKVKDCLLLYEGANSCEICKASPQSTTSLMHHGARYIIPFTKKFPHFEVWKNIFSF